MQRHLVKNKQALSSLSLIILLLIAAIIGGIISYLWVTGYYISLTERIPEQNTVAITNLAFNPQNATAFNLTLLNPSFSPSDTVGVSAIGYNGQNETTMHFVGSSIPALTTPWYISKGSSQTFVCRGNLTPYLNQTLEVSVFVINGSGSTNSMKIPFTRLVVSKTDFNSIVGVKNFTVTLRNDALSAATLDVTGIAIDQTAINITLITPTLPYSLSPNRTVTLTLDYNWSSYAAGGGSHQISVSTKEGYSALNSTQVPKLAFSIQQMSFNESDTTDFTLSVKNEVSTNTPLNVSRIDVIMDNATIKNVTPTLNSYTNGVLGNSTATFNISWDWTTYRYRSVGVTVYMLQGVQASAQRFTPGLSILNATFPDSQHVFVAVKNSQYSGRAANVTKITVTLENGTEEQVQITQPPTSPYIVGIGNVTVFGASWDWQTYLNKTVVIQVYTSEGLKAIYVTRTS